MLGSNCKDPATGGGHDCCNWPFSTFNACINLSKHSTPCKKRRNTFPASFTQQQLHWGWRGWGHGDGHHRISPGTRVAAAAYVCCCLAWRGAALVWGRCLLVSSVAPQPSTRQLPPTSTTNNYSDYFRFQLAVKYLKKLWVKGEQDRTCTRGSQGGAILGSSELGHSRRSHTQSHGHNSEVKHVRGSGGGGQFYA